MTIKSILVSQPAPIIFEKSPFYELSSKHGLEIEFRPFMKNEGVSLKEFRSQRVELLSHSAIIFTSRTTIDHFFRICEEARVVVPETMKYFCNSEAVALYLQKYIVYRKRKISFANGTFDNFMRLIIKNKDEKFLVTLSEPYNPELVDTMQKLKINFDKAVLSRSVSSDLSDVDLKRYDLMVFYSPTEIATLVSVFGKESLPNIATFGNGTARAIMEHQLTLSVMAPTPQVPSMTKAIDLFVERIKQGEKIEPIVIDIEKQADKFIKAHELKGEGKSRSKKG